MATLAKQLQTHGLKLLSVIQQDVAQPAFTEPVPTQQGSILPSGQSLFLIGNSSEGMWPVFSQSQEYLLGKSDPLDRWSKRLGEQFAQQYDGRAIYPFTGPPYQPFLSWAQHNGDSFQSPLGLHIHLKYGLWHGYRFGLILDLDLDLDLNKPAKSKLTKSVLAANPLTKGNSTKDDSTQSKPTLHPCTSCIQPCMQACPVSAFSADGYDVVACRTYVQQNPQTSCAQHGCAARLACPVSPQGGYVPEQHQYHMAIFARQT
jgi:epoxyqueuosine reductase